jgi:hypothetical protein
VKTLATLIDTFDVDVHDHLDRSELVPTHDGLQFQGDVAVVPAATHAPTSKVTVPAAGIPVVRGENGGNTHLLLAAGPVTWAPVERARNGLDLGLMHVPDGATAYLAHPEHGYLGVGPGRYVVRRQREQADVVRLVAD